MWERLKNWFDGEFVPRKSDPDSRLLFLNGGAYKRPLLARFLSSFAAFFLANWQFLVTSVLAIAIAAATIHYTSGH